MSATRNAGASETIGARLSRSAFATSRTGQHCGGDGRPLAVEDDQPSRSNVFTHEVEVNEDAVGSLGPQLAGRRTLAVWRRDSR
jgi:hypothetical protein